MSGYPGMDLGGVRALADLHDRCRPDDLTGCLVWAGCVRKGSARIWMHAAGGPVSMSRALALLVPAKAKAIGPGQRLIPMVCGNAQCANPEHWRPGTHGDYMRLTRPKLDPLHRQRIAEGHRRRDDCQYSLELRAEILASEETGTKLAERIGLHHSVISRVRRGEAWRPSAAGSSVFNLGQP